MKKLFIIIAAVVILSNVAVANITITPDMGENYTYQRWDFDTIATILATGSPPMAIFSDIVPETDQNPYGSPLATVVTYGSDAGWYDNLNGQDVMRASTYKLMSVTLTIPNLENEKWLKIVQIESAYEGALVAPTISVMGATGIAEKISEVYDTDSEGWPEVTSTWHIIPQPESETIMLVLTGGANGVNLNYVEVATVCIVPEPASICLLGLGGLALLRKKR